MMTNDEIAKRFDEGSRQFTEIRGEFAEIRGQLADVLKALEPLPQMKRDIATAKKNGASTKELVEAWNAVKTGGKFVRWIAPLIGAIGGAWVFVKTGIARIFP